MSPVLIGILIAVLVGLAVATWKAPRLTSILIWAMVAAVLVSAAGALMAPGAVRERVLWTIMLFPVVWVALQFWCYWDQRKWRVVSGLLLMSAVSGVIVAITELDL